MDSLTVHFVKWTNQYIFCYPFHEMDKVMYESLTFIHGQSFGLILSLYSPLIMMCIVYTLH